MYIYSLVLSIAFGTFPAGQKTDALCNMSSMDFLLQTSLDKTVDYSNPDTSILDAAIFHLTNVERKRIGLKALKFSKALYKSSMLHNAEMIRHGYLSHQNKRGMDFFDRILQQDKSFRMGAENIATILPFKVGASVKYTYKKRNGKFEYHTLDGKPLLLETYRTMATKLVANWMNSPGHKKNILNKELTHIGCSLIISANIYASSQISLCYGTQDFGGY
jgi:uncharacterized protein YkwD